MKQSVIALVLLLIGSANAFSQTAQATPQNQTKQVPPQQRDQTPFEISEYGVDILADERLIVVMAALEAAGFDAQPGREPSVFRAMVRRDLAGLNPDLRTRLQTFYQRNALPSPATPAEQASRYVTLALALEPAPNLEAPERTDDLPGGLLEVLDFAPLVREFYRTSGIQEKMINYVRAYQAEGDRLRKPATEMVRGLLTYLHTRPITSSLERVEVKPPAGKKKSKQKAFSYKEKERRFLILPDLLSPRGAVNFRVILDDYYAIVPEGTDPSSSELRRAYLQYVIDALVLRYNKDIATRREQVKLILDDRQKAGNQVSPDVFLSVSRSLVAAADARFDEVRKTESLARETRSRLNATKDDKARAAIVKETQTEAAAIQDDTVARLADEYEKGAVLSFYFAEQLKGIESSGFDIANFFSDMIASFDPTREMKRPAEYADARQRSINARQARLSARRAEADVATAATSSPRDAKLVKDLSEIEDTLKLKDYNTAEQRLKVMLTEYPKEPRVFFALAQTASVAASDATDEQVQAERLGRALTNYRFAVMAASPEFDKALISRAHESMGRINAFLENNAEALKAFEAAIQIGDVRGGAYKEAIEGKKKLQQP